MSESIPHIEHVEALAEKLSKAVRTEHCCKWDRIPHDIQQLFLESAFRKIENLMRDYAAASVQVNKKGWWCLVVKGNACIAESAAKKAGFDHACSVNPTCVWLRPATYAEADFIGGECGLQLRAKIDADISEEPFMSIWMSEFGTITHGFPAKTAELAVSPDYRPMLMQFGWKYTQVRVIRRTDSER